MKERILIIGSGFAGMWSALSAARLVDLHNRENIEVMVLAPKPELCVRPRLYEANADKMVSQLAPLYQTTGVVFVQGKVEKIDTVNKQVGYCDQQGNQAILDYDRLVLASGSHVRQDLVPGVKEFTFNLDQLESAIILEKHLQDLALLSASQARNTVVVCGGGFTGIEMAMELPARLKATLGSDIDVVIIDRGSSIGSNYSVQMQAIVKQASQELGVRWLLNSSIDHVDEQGVYLKNGLFIESKTVIWTVGVQASTLTAQIVGTRDKQGRLVVDEHLKVVGQDNVYATGDVAHAVTDNKGNIALMTCQHAIPLGKFAGNNVAASLLGIEPLTYRQENYVTCLDLGAWGAVFTEGWEQNVNCIRQDAKKIKIAITNDLIYPPKADRVEAFKIADPLAPFV
ncbi:NAD(P)/FAD-dependent oxidoreductase [Neisseria sp. Ec49-e6-T10]|uniref:NAD(P)/FAD-dependent oxidoreductase n=1 Tax=Neisseria sp. Ec49-e6-T10 TaxID=3140744 RepID=UPI003EB6BF4C